MNRVEMEKLPTKPFDSKTWPLDVESDDSDMENEIDVDKLPPLTAGPNENRLQHTYCLWYSRKGTARAQDYSKSLHVVGRCASVQQWWSLYSHLIRPTALKPYRELSLFKQGIKPMWEDPANTKGGQWVIRLRKNKIDRAWENVCMAMLGEQFLVGDEICGVVLTTKYPKLWLDPNMRLKWVAPSVGVVKKVQLQQQRFMHKVGNKLEPCQTIQLVYNSGHNSISQIELNINMEQEQQR